jgi:hypothetical protein
MTVPTSLDLPTAAGIFTLSRYVASAPRVVIHHGATRTELSKADASAVARLMEEQITDSAAGELVRYLITNKLAFVWTPTRAPSGEPPATPLMALMPVLPALVAALEAQVRPAPVIDAIQAKMFAAHGPAYTLDSTKDDVTVEEAYGALAPLMRTVPPLERLASYAGVSQVPVIEPAYAEILRNILAPDWAPARRASAAWREWMGVRYVLPSYHTRTSALAAWAVAAGIPAHHAVESTLPLLELDADDVTPLPGARALLLSNARFVSAGQTVAAATGLMTRRGFDELTPEIEALCAKHALPATVARPSLPWESVQGMAA